MQGMHLSFAQMILYGLGRTASADDPNQDQTLTNPSRYFTKQFRLAQLIYRDIGTAYNDETWVERTTSEEWKLNYVSKIYQNDSNRRFRLLNCESSEDPTKADSPLTMAKIADRWDRVPGMCIWNA